MDLPTGKTAMRCEWVYKIKTHIDGSVECYKARLVVKGLTQEYGIDYEKFLLQWLFSLMSEVLYM